MAAETILQHWIFTSFIYPFLLVFFISYAILEKTKLLGDGKHQINAIVAFVLGIVFVGGIFPKIVVENLILFLTVALIVMFVFLMLWGFAVGGEVKIEGNGLKLVAGGILAIAVFIAVLWATGIEDRFFDMLFGQPWSSAFWTNVLFIVVIAVAIAVILKNK